MPMALDDERVRQRLRGVDHRRPLVLTSAGGIRYYACRICTNRHGIWAPGTDWPTREEHAAHIAAQHQDWLAE